MAVAYLEKLNSEQRRAVEHGVREDARQVRVDVSAKMRGMWR